MSEWKEVIASDFCTEVTDGTHDSPKPVSVGKYLHQNIFKNIVWILPTLT